MKDFWVKRKNRKSIRLKGYDYSGSGAYFATICVQKRKCIFGEIINKEMMLNDIGQIVQTVWDGLPDHYSHVRLDMCSIMPNHIHGIIILQDDNIVGADLNVGAGFKPAPTVKRGKNKRHGLPEIIRGFKTFSSRRINEYRDTKGRIVWQRNYYEHIVRNEKELDRIREYVINNPIQWESDKENPHLQSI